MKLRISSNGNDNRPTPSIIDSLPEHWASMRLKDVAWINRQTLPENGDPEREILYVDIGNVNVNGLDATPEKMRFGQSPSRARRVVKKHDTIISTVRTYLKAVAYFEDPPPDLIASTGFAVLTPRAGVFPKYLYYLVRNPFFIDLVTASSVGVSYPAINASVLASLPAWLPPLPEQRAIAAFLDHKTAQIDALIAEKQRLITLLQEKRNALISHAVTKGLDAGARMKDSGVPWIGEAPEHWEVVRFKLLGHFRSGGTPSRDDLQYWNGDIPWISPKDMKVDVVSTSEESTTEEAHKAGMTAMVEPGAVLIVVRSGILKHTIPVAVNTVKVTFNQDIKGFIPEGHRIDSMFLMRFLSSHQQNLLYQWRKQGATVESLEHALMANTPIPVPPLHEQGEISTYIERENQTYESLNKDLVSSIEKMTEYRTALISAAVTGKIDVRQWREVEDSTLTEQEL